MIKLIHFITDRSVVLTLVLLHHVCVKVRDILPPGCYCWSVCERCTMAGKGRGEIFGGGLESSLLY